MDNNWIRVALSPEEDDRPHLAVPFAVTIDGRAHAACTNGHYLLAAPGEAAPFEADPVVPQNIPTWFDEPGAHFTASLADLRAWADRVVNGLRQPDKCATCNGEKETPCGDCNGTGRAKCNMGHEHDCTCPASRKRTCWSCDGSGLDRMTEDDRSKRPGMLGDAVVDCRLLAAMIAHAPGETVGITTRGPRGTVTMIGDDWRGAIMPVIRVVPNPEPAPLVESTK